MRRVEIANRFALAAKEAERLGEHRRAAELYADALRVLLGHASEKSERPLIGDPRVSSEAPGDAPASDIQELADSRAEAARVEADASSEPGTSRRGSAPSKSTLIRRNRRSSLDTGATVSELQDPRSRIGRSR